MSEDRSSSLRIVKTSGDRIELTATFDGKPWRGWVRKSNPGMRGSINIETIDGQRAGNLGMMRERDCPNSQCPHHKRLVSMLFGSGNNL